MKRKYKLKPVAKITLALLIIFITILVIYLLTLHKNNAYSLEYNLNDYKISENYEENYYYYEIKIHGTKFNFINEKPYIKEKRLINKIQKFTDNDYTCHVVISDYIKTNPLCTKESKIIDYHLVPNKLKEKMPINNISPKQLNKKYKNYEIYSEDDNILIWSYKGFDYFNKSKHKKINMFKKDIYEIPLATKVNRYIMIPNYEQDHYFNEIYLLNLDTMELNKWKIKYNISFDSYIIGTHDMSIFLVDRKSKKEYELVPHKKRIRIVGKQNKKGIIYDNEKQTSIAIEKLISKEYKFRNKNIYNFSIVDKKLYLSYLDSPIKIKLSEEPINSIVRVEKDTVYYLRKDILYRFNLKDGEVKLIKYPEWNFNNKNLIFIND